MRCTAYTLTTDADLERMIEAAKVGLTTGDQRLLTDLHYLRIEQRGRHELAATYARRAADPVLDAFFAGSGYLGA